MLDSYLSNGIFWTAIKNKIDVIQNSIELNIRPPNATIDESESSTPHSHLKNRPYN